MHTHKHILPNKAKANLNIIHNLVPQQQHKSAVVQKNVMEAVKTNLWVNDVMDNFFVQRP